MSPAHPRPARSTAGAAAVALRLTVVCGTARESDLPLVEIGKRTARLHQRRGCRMSFVRTVRMRVPAGTAKPGPAIGQALGPLGINMMEFCKKFNEETKHVVQNTPMPCVSSGFAGPGGVI